MSCKRCEVVFPKPAVRSLGVGLIVLNPEMSHQRGRDQPGEAEGPPDGLMSEGLKHISRASCLRGWRCASRAFLGVNKKNKKNGGFLPWIAKTPWMRVKRNAPSNVFL